MRRRLRSLPWARIGIGTAAVLAVVAVVPPLRSAAAVVLSRGVLLVASPLAPDIAGFDDLPQTTRVLATDGSVVAELDGGERREQLDLHRVPDHVPKAVLAAEDARFYRHAGVDPAAVLRAVLRNARGGSQGGSTITQQLAKLNYTGSQRTVLRKLREVLYATELEKTYSKDELLERYLNQVYFGDGSYGLSAAARSYFGVPAEQLTPAQAATLAGKIRAPEALDPRTGPDAVRRRRDQVLAAMARNGWLDPAALQQALAEPLTVVPAEAAASSRAPHFVERVRREAQRLDALGASRQTRSKQLFTGGYTIESTLDTRAFDAATRAVQGQLGQPGDPTTAVVSVVPGDGAIRILFGGLDPGQKFDTATQAERQPGSAFKPFVYLAALRDGIDPRSVLDASSPQSFTFNDETFPVNNYEGEGGGQSTIDDAMVHSINTVFMRLGLMVGPDDVVRFAQAAGIEKPIQPVAAVSLGGIKPGVSPLEMASAYATFAARGTYAEPYAIARITDREGRVVYTHTPETRKAFEEKEVGVLTSALRRVVREGTGTGAAIGRDVAGKTGTTSGYRDAYFVGYVPQLATAVWVGHLDNRPMTDVHGRRVSGGSFPASIFRLTMRGALDGVPSRPLFTATPDELGLRMLAPTTTTTIAPPPTTRSPTTSTTLTAAGGPTTTVTHLGRPTTTLAPTRTTVAPTRTTVAPTRTTLAPTTTTAASTPVSAASTPTTAPPGKKK